MHGYATHSDLDFETVKMATSVLKVALMVFFVLIICTIILVPIALMLTLEDKEEQKSTVPLSKLKKTTEEPMAKTASPTTTTPIVTLATTTLSCHWSKNSDNTWVKICEGECKGNHSSKGDGICDDINNNLECGYDGNDCCGPNVNKGWISLVAVASVFTLFLA